MKIIVAPLQGFTDCFWRRAHAHAMQRRGLPVAAYCAPFVRIDKGEPRRRDLADIAPRANEGLDVLPQAIFRDADELGAIASAISALGYSRINLNLGCPFPPQVKAGRGAGALRPEALAAATAVMAAHPDIRFSVKMRPGVRLLDEWSELADTLNAMPLEFVAIHPRTAVQAYRGEVDRAVFAEMAHKLHHPVVFNGNLTTPEQVGEVFDLFPTVAAVMVGRGVLARPSLPAEVLTGKEWSDDERVELWLEILRDVACQLSEASCGEAQALSRIQPRLEYAEAALPRSLLKALRKARTLSAFTALL